MSDYISPVFQTGQEVDAALTAGLQSGTAMFSETTADVGIDISEITGIVKETNRSGRTVTSGTVCISLDSNTDYDTYYYIATAAADIYIKDVDLPQYMAICYGSNYTGQSTTTTAIRLECTSPVRKRKSDSNLPSESSKLHISSGDVVAFTVNAGQSCKIYGLSTDTETSLDIKQEFKRRVSLDRCYLRYLAGKGMGDSTEMVEIYIPSTTKIIKYNFVHSVKASINADVWRIENAVICDNNMNEQSVYTTSGEWECAIKLSGRSDFSGGRMHGDEVMSEITFLLDGSLVDITDYTELTAFDTLSIFQASVLYDPNDSTTQIANHGSQHIFCADGVTVKQKVKWKTASTVEKAYLAMFPPAKAVTDNIIDNNSFAVTALPTDITETEVTEVTLYSDTLQNSSYFAINDYPQGVGTLERKFICTDNSGNPYNKCYYASVFSNTYTTAVDEVWSIKVKYSISA